MRVLLVEPNFPISKKSKNHQDFLPIGLLKLSTFYKDNSDAEIKLVRFDEDFEKNCEGFDPDIIHITSLFTYWSKYVKETVDECRKLFGNTVICVGGIYASLMPKHCEEYTGCDVVFHLQLDEKYLPDYSLVDVDYQIIHTTRGCIRECDACGVNIIEPKFKSKKSIKDEIVKRKLIFYDNNLLANLHIHSILNELIQLKKEKKIDYCESQSGFDGRILLQKPYLAERLKQAGFKHIKIAWDGDLNEWGSIKKQLMLLFEHFSKTDVSVFVLYNHDLPYEIMEEKRVHLWNMGVQVMDCRYRPLDATFDNYSSHSRRGQTSEDYYIHPNWTDKEIRQFRKNVRIHNLCIRYAIVRNPSKYQEVN